MRPKDSLAEAHDRVVAGRAADGDPRAFEVLVRRYSTLMRVYARSILGTNDEVDDVVQEAFVTAWQQLELLEDPGAVKGWLMRIVSRRSIDRLRARHEHEDIIDYDPPAEAAASPAQVAQARSLADAVGAALASLPAGQRRCWLLKEVAEYSYREIAADLEIPESTVRGLISRARVNMAREMQAWR
ncbi:RNA polymerase sigma factor [Gryllotalpicola protaetiae]|uniref:RNA polymerase sigma factor n=1 Tax=Gryllotalpicola protaetiae TaxID=2419771 RepID=A0A387BVX8_9MICO|nr:RNA polymerase sigma factor [Gryllotalpicola protaetiae]